MSGARLTAGGRGARGAARAWLLAACVCASASCGSGADAAGKARAGSDASVVVGTAPALSEPPASGAADLAGRDAFSRAGLEPQPDPQPDAGAWSAPLRALAARWIERARVTTDGRVHGGNVRVALHVVDLESGIELAGLDADRPQRPASNLKLVTTAAALVLFGPGAEFATPIEAAGPLAKGRLEGDLVLRASGDPLVAPESDPVLLPRVRRTARALAARGLRVVAGDLVLDEGTFLTPGPGPSWPDASQHWQEYCALSGGFSVNGGVLEALVTPTRPGQAARILVEPAPHGLRPLYRVETVAGAKIAVGGDANLSRCLVQGELGAEAEPFRAQFRHPDPVAHFGALFQAALAAEGIRVLGAIRRERNVPGGELLAELRSPLLACLRPINADSRNGVADQLFFALGHAVGAGGTRAGGQAAIQRALERLGVASTGLVQVDGSGLSFDDRIAPRQITEILRGVLALGGEARAAYLDSFAVAGERGTLDARLRGSPAEGRVYAKTGWIRGTSALSGIVDSLEGRLLCFSLLIEYPTDAGGLNTRVFKPFQDELAVFLVEEPLPFTREAHSQESHGRVR